METRRIGGAVCLLLGIGMEVACAGPIEPTWELMAAAAGIKTSPHISRGGLGFLYLLHMVSACPNADLYHEFKMFKAPPIESKAGPFECIDGKIKAPEGSGLGIIIDPDFIKTHKAFE